MRTILNITLPDVETKQAIKAAARKRGLSVSLYILRATGFESVEPDSIMVDEATLDAAWQTDAVGVKMKELSTTLKRA